MHNHLLPIDVPCMTTGAYAHQTTGYATMRFYTHMPDSTHMGTIPDDHCHVHFTVSPVIRNMAGTRQITPCRQATRRVLKSYVTHVCMHVCVYQGLLSRPWCVRPVYLSATRCALQCTTPSHLSFGYEMSMSKEVCGISL